MADFTLTARTTEAYASQKQNSGVVTMIFNGGDGTTKTTVKAAVADTEHLVVGGHVSVAGATLVKIYSGTTVIGALQFAAAGTLPLPEVHTEPNELLAVESGTSVAIWGAIEYISLTTNTYNGMVA